MSRTQRLLPADMIELLKRGGGVIDVPTAKAVGIDPRRLQRLVGNQRLIRLTRGCYVDREDYLAASPWRQYELRSRAFVMSCGPFTFLTEWSSIAAWGLPTIGEPPSMPIVVQRKQPGRGRGMTPGGRIRVAELPTKHMQTIGHTDGPRLPRIIDEEKQREWELRRIGVDFVRYGYREAYFGRARLAERFQALLRDNPAQSQPMRWWKHDPDLGPVDPKPEDQPSPYPSSIILPAAWSQPQ